MNEPFISDSKFWFFVPERSVWDDFCDAFPVDEDLDLESAENVLDDIILFEV